MSPAGFYSISPEQPLRFGDIVRGFPITHIDMNSAQRFDISVGHLSYAVVMSPCCSIRDNVLSLCVLKPLDKKYFKAPKLKENPLLLNARMLAKDAIPPGYWATFTEQDVQKQEAKGLAYAFNTAFIFAPNPLLPTNENGSYYEIDFREICCVKSESIKNPETPVNLVDKILELSDDSRILLRDKLQDYYSRIVVAGV